MFGMESLRERIRKQVDRLDERFLPELARTLEGLQQKAAGPETLIAMWEAFVKETGEGQTTLAAALERRPLFTGRGLDRFNRRHGKIYTTTPITNRIAGTHGRSFACSQVASLAGTELHDHV
jgi:hypothetical protein